MDIPSLDSWLLVDGQLLWQSIYTYFFYLIVSDEETYLHDIEFWSRRFLDNSEIIFSHSFTYSGDTFSKVKSTSTQ